MTVFPVILSGGAGTRLWPLSRAMYPKQFIRFFGDGAGSFLTAALQRLSNQEGFAGPTIICNNDHRFLVRAECDRAGINPRLIALEPEARNTAPAIAAAALLVADEADAVLCIMPSDHVIEDTSGFVDAVRQAAEVARTKRLVLFGIQPSEAHTGYGYIHAGEPINAGPALAVRGFTEKPDSETAEAYTRSGDHFWNSGIFVLHAATFLEELGRFQPEILDAVDQAVRRAAHDLDFLRLDQASFAKAPSISVDYAVMEKTEKTVVIPLSIGWNDVGSWKSLWEISNKDNSENVAHGDAILQDTTGTFVHSERSLVVTLGVKDLVIVDTPDALLVADREKAQQVGGIVSVLRESGRREHEQHLRNYRPWGYFETLSLAPRFQVKLLHVTPGCQLSMQMHHHRSEHWIVVKGTAKVTVGENASLIRENESLYISATEWHRVENPGKVPLELIEVQIGSYLGEDDIVRSDDIYNRSPSETR